jgi:hypothetical protein
MESQKKDIINEAIKIVYLEHADLLNDEDTDKEIAKIKSELVVGKLSAEKEGLLFSMLTELIMTESLGQMIARQMNELKINQQELAKNTLLPTDVINALISDEIYTNNVPILLFKKLAEQLHLKFTVIEQSIKKTLQLLGDRAQVKDLSLQPAFRKGFYLSRGSSTLSNTKTDGKELYENSESMEKYLNRLKELLN